MVRKPSSITAKPILIELHQLEHVQSMHIGSQLQFKQYMQFKLFIYLCTIVHTYT